MSSEVKKMLVVYVAPIPREMSGISRDVPAHVVLEWRDDEGRRCKRILDLPDSVVQEISRLPKLEQS